MTFPEMCADQRITKRVFSDLKKHWKGKLEHYEIPSGLVLEPEPWTPHSGLVTASMKLKRKEIQQKYSEIVKNM